MFITVRYGDDQSLIFNINCRNEVLLNQIKKRCKIDHDDIIDLSDEHGMVKNLRQNLQEYGNEYLKERETLILLKVDTCVPDHQDEDNDNIPLSDKTIFTPMLTTMNDNQDFIGMNDNQDFIGMNDNQDFIGMNDNQDFIGMNDNQYFIGMNDNQDFIGMNDNQDFIGMNDNQDFIGMNDNQDFIGMNDNQDFIGMNDNQDFIGMNDNQDFIGMNDNQDFIGMNDNQDFIGMNDNQDFIDALNPKENLSGKLSSFTDDVQGRTSKTKEKNKDKKAKTSPQLTKK